MNKKLKLYVWEDVLCDYTCGMICVLALSLEQAFSLIKEKYDEYYLDDLASVEPKVIEEPEAFAVYGGG